MRWASDSDLTVHRLPSGKQGSVFAFVDELAEWALKVENNSEEKPKYIHQETHNFKDIAKVSKWPLIGLIPLIGVAGIVIATLPPANSPQRGDQQSAATPDDPAVAADYIKARDLWARRTAKDLDQSITLYQSVIRRDPSFAPAFAGLADAWLIYREYGDMSEAEAYQRASTATEKALRLDPSLASALRAKGFIDYWWHYDADRSLASFQKV